MGASRASHPARLRRRVVAGGVAVALGAASRAGASSTVPLERASCSEPVTREALTERIAAADEAYQAFSLQGDSAQFDRFEALKEEVVGGIVCLHDVVQAQQAADAMRIVGMTQLVSRQGRPSDADEARVWYAGARFAMQNEGGIAFPDILGVNDPADETWEDVPLSMISNAARALPPAQDGNIFVNGRPALSAPTSVPTIVQLVGRSGAVEWTQWVPAGAVFPSYETAVGTTSSEAGASRASMPLRPRSPSTPAWVVTGVALLAAGVTAAATSPLWYELSGCARSADSPSPSCPTDPRRVRAAADTQLGVGAGAAGVGAVFISVPFLFLKPSPRDAQRR